MPAPPTTTVASPPAKRKKPTVASPPARPARADQTLHSDPSAAAGDDGVAGAGDHQPAPPLATECPEASYFTLNITRFKVQRLRRHRHRRGLVYLQLHLLLLLPLFVFALKVMTPNGSGSWIR